jgi:hypothetical protein
MRAEAPPGLSWWTSFPREPLERPLSGVTPGSPLLRPAPVDHTSAGTAPLRAEAAAEWKASRSCSTATAIVAPTSKVPARIALAIGVSSSRWMARFRGRAPYTGS